MHGKGGGTVAVLYSGGLDSSILLYHLLRQGREVQPLYIESGLIWQKAERRAALGFCRQIAAPKLKQTVFLKLPVADLYGDHWSVTGRGAPPAGTSDEAVYLPGRNPLLIIKARLWCQLNQIDSLALGCLGSNPFQDATGRFFDAFEAALDSALSGTVRLQRPFEKLDKRSVMELGRDAPLELTFSCLSPRRGKHCGRCNKCDERRAAFALAGRDDANRQAAALRSLAAIVT